MKLFAYFITTSFLLIISGIIIFFYGLWYFGKDLPDYKELSKYNPKVVTRIHAGNGALLAEYAIEKRVFLPINVIPKNVINAFISAEDKDFYNHFGLDLKATLRAILTNIKNIGSGKRLIGASTITQQVAKNFLLSSEVSFERKIKEAILAIRIERAFSKNQILELYLNEIYLGFKSYGVAAASLNYFDKSLDNLDLAEAAFLAALPKAPNNYNPIYKLKQAVNRRNWVLNQMNRNGYIDDKTKELESIKVINIRKSTGIDEGYAPYFTEEVRKILLENKKIGTGLYTNGYSVRTTLDPFMQFNADYALINGLENLDKRQGWRGPLDNLDLLKLTNNKILKYLQNIQEILPKNREAAVVTEVNKDLIKILLQRGISAEIKFLNAAWVRPQTIKKDKKNKLNIYLGNKFKNFKQFLKVGDVIVAKKNYNKDNFFFSLSQVPIVNGAIVALDPHTGRVLAMSGGYSFKNSEFNRATQAKRQPGSAFKPFVYLAGLERFYKPTDLILDAALAYDQCSDCEKWKPANYTKKFYGPSPMRLGIEKSRNLMTARLAIKLIKEEQQIENYIEKGYSNKIIGEKLNKDIRFVDFIVKQIAAKKKNSKIIKNKNIENFSIKHNLDKEQLLSYIEQNLNVDQIHNKIFVNKSLINNLLKSLSTKNIIQHYAHKFGISKDLPPFLSMSLGAGETDLLSLTNAYGMIINGGKKITPTLIDRIQDRRGFTIYKHDKRFCEHCNGKDARPKNIPSVAIKDTREEVISSSSAYQMVSMLKGAIDRGTGIVIKSLGKNLAGKTGTTNSNTDAWFVGFSSDLVVGVFVGFDDPRPLGFKETGSSVAAPIFKDFMKNALLNSPDIPFRRPAGIKVISVNSKTGLQVSAEDKKSIMEAFKPGQLPNLMFDQNFIDFKNSNTVIKNLSPLY